MLQPAVYYHFDRRDKRNSRENQYGDLLGTTCILASVVMNQLYTLFGTN